MRRYSFTARLRILALAATFFASLAMASAAQAIVVHDGASEAGVVLVPNARTSPTQTLPGGVTADTTSSACMDPWLSSDFGGPLLPPGGPFSAPASDSLCYRGGAVIHKNETFALTWDAPFSDGSQRHYWPHTKQYVQQFLRDVGDGSGSLGSPFAITSQYHDSAGAALNASLFGGGCIDNGAAGGSACDYPLTSGPGNNYPANGCTPAGDSFVAMDSVSNNEVCLTDAQLQSELSTMVAQTGILTPTATKSGYTPLVTLLLPPGVETCLDATHTLCSANASLTPPPPVVTTAPVANPSSPGLPAGNYEVEITYQTGGGQSAISASQTITTTGSSSSITIDSPPPAPGATGWYAYVTADNGTVFERQGGANIGTDMQLTGISAGVAPPADSAYCSYHSQVNVGGTEVAYVVQPWSVGTSCDEPDVPTIQANPPAETLEVDAGTRLVSPLSQAEIAAIVDPNLNGWVAQDGSEIDDNGVVPPGFGGQFRCQPLGHQLDQVTVGSSAQNPYFLQREFNNAGAIDSNPFTYEGCAPVDTLAASFVVPSAVDPGDVIQFDGSNTASTLLVPDHGYSASSGGYLWNFGDGTTATGPSVEHSYANGGTYNVTLTTTDRGGYTDTTTQTVQVLGGSAAPAATPTPTTTTTGSGSGSGAGSGAGSALLSVRLQLLPQSLKSVLRSGIAARVTSNKAANGIATVSITRAAARRAHIKLGSGPMVRIGLGTVASVQNGTVTLRLHLSPAVAKKLAHLGHVTMTVRLALVAAGNQSFAIDAAGRY